MEPRHARIEFDFHTESGPALWVSATADYYPEEYPDPEEIEMLGIETAPISFESLTKEMQKKVFDKASEELFTLLRDPESLKEYFEYDEER